MEEILRQAAAHEGSAFVEIFQNCVIFNDGAFEEVAGRKVRDDRTFDLHHGQRMVYGNEHDKGVRFRDFAVELVSADQAGCWDATQNTVAPAMLLAEMDADPNVPTPVGIFRNVHAPVFDEAVNAQVSDVLERRGPGRLEDLLYTKDCWKVS
jgi:2-oxoglutarate ferredoxin oxidoreductase subunit beta